MSSFHIQLELEPLFFQYFNMNISLYGHLALKECSSIFIDYQSGETLLWKVALLPHFILLPLGSKRQEKAEVENWEGIERKRNGEGKCQRHNVEEEWGRRRRKDRCGSLKRL